VKTGVAVGKNLDGSTGSCNAAWQEVLVAMALPEVENQD